MSTDTINTGTVRLAPFTKRVAAVLGHPALRRLKAEPQLGWIKEVYPSATHSRWAHTLGVFSSLVAMYNSLLADPEVPTFRVLANPVDIEHAMVAALLHDAGQTAFGHDFEAVPYFGTHESFVKLLLDEQLWGRPTLRQAIADQWPNVEIQRVLAILGSEQTEYLRPIDGIAQDSINGPIDADKLDYLVRDSTACCVPYGHGMDTERLLRALTVAAIEKLGHSRLTIAYKAKGRPAIESMLFARYQMYGVVYWHHTFRCIQAMFVHAVCGAFAEPEQDVKIAGMNVSTEDIESLFYKRVICGAEWTSIELLLGKKTRRLPRLQSAPPEITAELAMEFVWQFASPRYQKLLLRLAKRDLYRRIFEIRLDELGERGDYSALKSEFLALNRNAAATKIQLSLINKIDAEMRQRARPATSLAENSARKRLQAISDLSKHDDLLVVHDFPVRGLPTEDNIPFEMGDPQRKYYALPDLAESGESNVFHGIRKLQAQIAALRVFAATELHELIIRYLTPEDVRACVGEVVKQVK